MTRSLRDKIIVITGASSGIGMDAARLFALEGCHLVLVARRQDRLEALKKEIQEDAASVMVISADIADLEQVQKLADRVQKTHGKVDILFNNAGYGRLDWLEKLSPGEDIRNLVEVNLVGSMQVTRAFLPGMLAQHSGHIIMMSSVAGLIPAPMYSIYAATKFGLRGFMNCLRREVGVLGIKVSGIYPGPVLTEFSQHTGSDNAVREIVKPPRWIYLDSRHVAQRVVELARHPRRMLIIPWYYRVGLWIETLVPGWVDRFLDLVIVKRSHIFTSKT